MNALLNGHKEPLDSMDDSVLLSCPPYLPAGRRFSVVKNTMEARDHGDSQRIPKNEESLSTQRIAKSTTWCLVKLLRNRGHKGTRRNHFCVLRMIRENNSLPFSSL